MDGVRKKVTDENFLCPVRDRNRVDNYQND
jgi:hypothetical protein